MGLPRMYSIPDDPKLRYTSVKGVTIFQLDANAPSAQAISALARGLWDLINAPQPVVDEEAALKGKQPVAARQTRLRPRNSQRLRNAQADGITQFLL